MRWSYAFGAVEQRKYSRLWRLSATHLETIAPQSAQKNINLQILSPLPIPKINLDQQKEIVTELDAMQAELDGLKRLQSETAAEMDALLPAILDRAFRGEL